MYSGNQAPQEQAPNNMWETIYYDDNGNIIGFGGRIRNIADLDQNEIQDLEEQFSYNQMMQGTLSQQELQERYEVHYDENGNLMSYADHTTIVPRDVDYAPQQMREQITFEEMEEPVPPQLDMEEQTASQDMEESLPPEVQEALRDIEIRAEMEREAETDYLYEHVPVYTEENLFAYIETLREMHRKYPGTFPFYATVICTFALKFANQYNILDAPNQIDRFMTPEWENTVKNHAAAVFQGPYSDEVMNHPEFPAFYENVQRHWGSWLD